LRLQYEAPLNLLEAHKVHDQLDYILKYVDVPANKASAHKRFLEVTALLMLCLRDLAELGSLSKELQ